MSRLPIYSIEADYVALLPGQGKSAPGRQLKHDSGFFETMQTEMPNIPEFIPSQLPEDHKLTDAIVKVWRENFHPSLNSYDERVGSLVAYKLFSIDRVTENSDGWRDMFDTIACWRTIRSASGGLITPDMEEPKLISKIGPLYTTSARKAG